MFLNYETKIHCTIFHSLTFEFMAVPFKPAHELSHDFCVERKFTLILNFTVLFTEAGILR